MKYIIIVGDGMSDEVIELLGNKTPLEYANTPMMDRLAKNGICGLTNTIPEGLKPGSDVGNLSAMGYNPRNYYTGRAPIEAASMDIHLSPGELAYRCNLVTIENDVMVDFTAGHITSEEASNLIASLNEELGAENIRFQPGVSYRHLLFTTLGDMSTFFTPPHDITDKSVLPHIASQNGNKPIFDLMKASQKVFEDHPTNKKRIDRGEKPATQIWLWGQGGALSIPSFKERFNVDGGVISAVDLVKGLGKMAKLNVIEVEGATGFIDTNYKGKADAALKELESKDFIFVHIEATDETGHMGDLKLKLQAIEDLDAKIVSPIINEMDRRQVDYRVLILPDHPTPVRLKTHTSDPVPFILSGSGIMANNIDYYSETHAKRAGIVYDDAYILVEDFFRQAYIAKN